jgi:queuine tRNA-ribosyltransferase
MEFNFKILNKSGKTRTGIITTKHGEIRTPAFMPVGTCGTVKAMMPESVESTGADIILGNTYHLMLRPTAERVAHFGGLRKFINWQKPVLTDSGGYQVMSLSSIRKIKEEGVHFKSHLDGRALFLPPERSIEIQHLLDSTITMVLDECTPYPATHKQAKDSMELSMRWAKRSKDAFVKREGYGLFGIVQGSVFPDLRAASCNALMDIGFDGYAIGGLAVGEEQHIMFEVLDYTAPQLPEDKPRYLMGVGKPNDIIGAVKRGVDMFDCVLPTRSGRNGQAFTRNGAINIRNAKFADDMSPLDANCSCPCCTKYTKGYIHHLVKAKEILGAMLMTWHNLQFYQDMMQKIRDKIAANEELPDDVVELLR